MKRTVAVPIEIAEEVKRLLEAYAILSKEKSPESNYFYIGNYAKIMGELIEESK